jgi:methionyl-tRNA synthetase
MAYAQDVNAYLNEKEPWKTAKTDEPRTGTTLFVALCAINALKVALYPYLPFSSAQIHDDLGLQPSIETAGWSAEELKPGTLLRPAQPLYKKIEIDAAPESRLSA